MDLNVLEDMRDALSEMRRQRDELVVLLRRHNAYQMELEDAGFGVYSASDLSEETNSLLSRLKGKS